MLSNHAVWCQDTGMIVKSCVVRECVYIHTLLQHMIWQSYRAPDIMPGKQCPLKCAFHSMMLHIPRRADAFLIDDGMAWASIFFPHWWRMLLTSTSYASYDSSDGQLQMAESAPMFMQTAQFATSRWMCCELCALCSFAFALVISSCFQQPTEGSQYDSSVCGSLANK